MWFQLPAGRGVSSFGFPEISSKLEITSKLRRNYVEKTQYPGFAMRGGAWLDPRNFFKIPFLAPERPRSRSSKLLKGFGSKVRVVHASFDFAFERVDVSNDIAANIYSCTI